MRICRFEMQRIGAHFDSKWIARLDADVGLTERHSAQRLLFASKS